MLQPLKQLFATESYPELLAGLGEPDDAAVWRLDDDRALVTTVDFFPPVVDDPYDFGAIAAANALSDVYAVGGEAVMALNLVAFPESLDPGVQAEILRGGAEKVLEAGAVIAGGHTVTDDEPKYGLAVTGLVAPRQLLTKGGARAGDRLLLSKALGTGLITTALKRGKADAGDLQVAVASMSRLNRQAAQLARSHGVSAMTDVTGFGLAGHAREMLRADHLDFAIDFSSLGWLPGARSCAEAGLSPGGTGRNREYFAEWTSLSPDLGEVEESMIHDPQTSGGLLMAVPAERAQGLLHALLEAGEAARIIGSVVPGSGRVRISSDPRAMDLPG